jgi:tetratricopeptide (TPR) repeat protein
MLRLMDRAKSSLATILICIALAAATLALYWPVRGHEFVNFDDWGYIIQNPRVQSGLNWQTVKWAFTSTYASNWHPLTWLSHALDYRLFGLKAGGHHLVNVLWHAANTVLLFLVLSSLVSSQWSAGRRPPENPGRGLSSRPLVIWPCAFVAALFGLHPMHVESVAWIAERKDVLSTFFFLLTLGAYARYVRTTSGIRSSESETEAAESAALPNQESVIEHRASGLTHGESHCTFATAVWYSLALILFAFGLMSKAMLVTLPFLLLLLDFWPLGRVAGAVWPVARNWPTWRWLLLEKLPFFALSTADSALTFIAQHSTGATATFEAVPFDTRVANAILSYGLYLKKFFWPTPMAVYYPYREHPPVFPTVFSILVLIAFSILAVRQRRARPYLLVGWCWFLGTLVPVIGLVQVGLQSMADRYTYIPYIGIFVATTWAIADVFRDKVFSVQYSVSSNGQMTTPSAGAVPQGAKHLVPRVLLLLAAVSILSACFLSASAQIRYWTNSETLWRHTVNVTEGNAVARQNLGSGLVEQRRFAEAAEQFQEALRVKPLYADAASNFGFVLAAQGNIDDAIVQYRQALALKPSIDRTHYLLGAALLTKGELAEAIEEFRAALKLNPDLPPALNDFAWVLASNPDPAVRDGTEAVRLAERACEITRFRDPQMIGTLAAAYAEAGRFSEAISTAEKAKSLAEQIGRIDLVERNKELIALYRQGEAYREPPPKPDQQTDPPGLQPQLPKNEL